MKNITSTNSSILSIFILCLIISSCATPQAEELLNTPYITVLGVAQDAGFPQAGCKKECCKKVWGNPEHYKKVVSLGIVDPISQETWLIEATPDFREQTKNLQDELPTTDNLKGIFLTHGHIGHYTGLMHLGREVMGANAMPVYAMPRMENYLKNNGPWSQLVKLNNISLQPMVHDSTIALNERISITPFLVPHRDEFTETVGYKIMTHTKSLIFIPDIDKWQKWDNNIKSVIKEVDYALLDATFYKNGEIPGRDMSEIPHPFVEESIALFKDMERKDKQKVYFIHFNHTNPLLKTESKEYTAIHDKGYLVAYEGLKLSL